MNILYGPIQLLAIGFDSAEIPEGTTEALSELKENDTFRMIDLIYISKNSDGDIIALEATDLSDEERENMGALIGALIGLGFDGEAGAEVGAEIGFESVAAKEFGLSKEDISDVVEDLPTDTAVALMLIEHVWAKNLKKGLLEDGGTVLANGFIRPESFVEFGALLRDVVDEASK